MTLGGVDLFADNMAYLWLSAALVPLSTALPFALYLLVGKKDLPQYLRFEKVGFLTGLLCVVGGLAICILGNYPAFFLQESQKLLVYLFHKPIGGEKRYIISRFRFRHLQQVLCVFPVHQSSPELVPGAHIRPQHQQPVLCIKRRFCINRVIVRHCAEKLFVIVDRQKSR